MKHRIIIMYGKQVVTIFLALSAMFGIGSAYTAGDCTNSNDPPASGNWNVSNTTTCSNTAIILNGGFNITDGGNVTFISTNLTLNLSANGRFNITVYQGGAFNASFSSIASMNHSTHYIFYVSRGTNFSMTDTLLMDAGWGPNNEKGFVINTTVNEFTRNTIINNSLGISIYSSYNNITNNTINRTLGFYGIVLYNGSDFNNISYNTIDHVLDCIVVSSKNNSVSFNTLMNSDVGVQFSLFGTETQFNRIFNNTAVNNNYSFSIPTSNNNTFYNNIANKNVVTGFNINGATNSEFYNNTVLTNQIGFEISSANNRIYENIIGFSTLANVYIHTAYAENTTLWKNAIYNSSQGIRFERAKYVLIKDSSIANESADDVYVGQTGNNITLLNVTFNRSKLNFVSTDTSILTVMWYLDIKVNDTSGNSVQGATVTAFDKNGNSVFSDTTGSDGRIGRKNVTEYVKNTTRFLYYTNYTINVTKNGYITNTTSINITQSTDHGISLTIDEAPIISFVLPTPDSGLNTSSQQITINVSHTEVNPDKLILNWNGTDETMNYSGSYTNITKSNLTDGNYTFYVWVNDTSGSSNQTETRVLRIDTTEPSTSVSFSASSAEPGSRITIYCSASDAGSGVSSATASIAKPNGAIISHSCGSAFTDTGSPGTYTVTFSATDNAGNSVSEQKTFVISEYSGGGSYSGNGGGSSTSNSYNGSAGNGTHNRNESIETGNIITGKNTTVSDKEIPSKNESAQEKIDKNALEGKEFFVFGAVLIIILFFALFYLYTKK